MKIRSRQTLAAVATLIAAPAIAGIIRHDVPPESFIVAEVDWPAVFPLYESKDCVATLIDAEWAITAAHCLSDMFEGRSGVLEGGKEHVLPEGGLPVIIAGQETRIVSVTPAPGFGRVVFSTYAGGSQSAYLRDVNFSWDAALLKLSSEISDVTPVPLYGGGAEVGKTVTLLGWGDFGTGDVGLVEEVNDGLFRRTENIVDFSEGHTIGWLFDDPASGMALELEGVNAPGDSGGPALIEVNDTWVLAGISSDGNYPGGEVAPQGQYGWREYYTRISAIKPWIDTVIND